VMTMPPFGCWKNRWMNLEFQRCNEKFRFCTEVYLSMKFFCAWNKSKTNNMYKQVFDVFCEDNSSF
jgi:hypothetical protein